MFVEGTYCCHPVCWADELYAVSPSAATQTTSTQRAGQSAGQPQATSQKGGGPGKGRMVSAAVQLNIC